MIVKSINGELEAHNLDTRPGSCFRAMAEFLLGTSWPDYEIIYIMRNPKVLGHIATGYLLHNEDGPAAVKTNGEMEWWLDGEKLFVKTQEEFECYMRNKAFW